MVHVFFQMFVLFMLTAPLITMRLLAEERKLRTLELLLTSPVSEIAIVLAKFTASMSLIVVMLLLSGCYAAALAWFGDPDFGPIYSGYVGLAPVRFGAGRHWASRFGADGQPGDRRADLRSACSCCCGSSTISDWLVAEPGRHAGGQSCRSRCIFGHSPWVRSIFLTWASSSASRC